MRGQSSIGTKGWVGLWLALVVAISLLSGCKRNPVDTVPEVQGQRAAIDARDIPKGFALLSAYPDDSGDELAIALEFTRPLVGTQDFDSLLAVTDANGAVVKGAWSLKDINSGASASGVLTTNMPPAGTYLAPRIHINNGSTAAAVSAARTRPRRTVRSSCIRSHPRQNRDHRWTPPC